LLFIIQLNNYHILYIRINELRDYIKKNNRSFFILLFALFQLYNVKMNDTVVSIEEVPSCVECMDTIVDGVMFPCNHWACRQHAQDLLDSAKERKLSTVRCALCQSTFEFIEDTNTLHSANIREIKLKCGHNTTIDADLTEKRKTVCDICHTLIDYSHLDEVNVPFNGCVCDTSKSHKTFEVCIKTNLEERFSEINTTLAQFTSLEKEAYAKLKESNDKINEHYDRIIEEVQTLRRYHLNADLLPLNTVVFNIRKRKADLNMVCTHMTNVQFMKNLVSRKPQLMPLLMTELGVVQRECDRIKSLNITALNVNTHLPKYVIPSITSDEATTDRAKNLATFTKNINVHNVKFQKVGNSRYVIHSILAGNSILYSEYNECVSAVRNQKFDIITNETQPLHTPINALYDCYTSEKICEIVFSADNELCTVLYWNHVKKFNSTYAVRAVYPNIQNDAVLAIHDGHVASIFYKAGGRIEIQKDLYDYIHDKSKSAYFQCPDGDLILSTYPSNNKLQTTLRVDMKTGAITETNVQRLMNCMMYLGFYLSHRNDTNRIGLYTKHDQGALAYEITTPGIIDRVHVSPYGHILVKLKDGSYVYYKNM
jgi:hypothetical protein